MHGETGLLILIFSNKVMHMTCRVVYDEMMAAARREKGRVRSTKGDNISSQQLQTAHDEYDDEATLFVFRLKSLKQGQSRSLLTQAARHHAAQVSFFKFPALTSSILLIGFIGYGVF